ncbi:uncharacterized protein LOC129716781 [Wyeomyia smithii]|uniref:uncharacterized protein LOC129716781 n=1 Tax=Wyeomyia smithii TaxID=174621 RepID=UPI002467E990|nr:uncharacterized protein LOC129716781 [Wyeomyia smithii]
MPVSTLRELQMQERQLRNTLMMVKQFTTDYCKERDELQIDVRLAMVEEALNKFYTVRRKIEVLTDSDDLSEVTVAGKEIRLETHFNENSTALWEFENLYCEIKAKLMSFKPNRQELDPPELNKTVTAPAPMSRVKLPDIKLPTFSGNLMQWITFRDSFRSLIHNNKSLSAIDKFTYLRASVNGEALQEIQTIELTEVNYDVAWSALEKRYENKKLILKTHLDAIFAAEPVRTESFEALNQLLVRLLTSKSKVSPLVDLKRKKKKQSIPRLELSSAMLLSHLYEKVRSTISFGSKATFWTDSMIVKCWLASTPSRWQPFVANRVSDIQHLTKGSSWNHVAGVENPADIVSRGMSPAQLNYSTLWWCGPTWLRQDKGTWPHTSQESKEDERAARQEEKASIVLATHVVTNSEIFSLRSSLLSLVRLVALLRRFAHNARKANRANRKLGFITYAESEEALMLLVRLSQHECFPTELAALSKGNQVAESSRLVGKNPKLINGVMHIGGRLKHAETSVGRKHPIILDDRHPLTVLILHHYHHKYYHAGQQLLISCVRERFWPLNIRRAARRIIYQCVPCFRSKPKVQDQLMADLPEERVNPAPPFHKVGLDYCGPFYMLYPGRKNRPIKCFVAVFVCLVTKAVHLEVVAYLTTQAFLAALGRFVARRSKPILIMCDNAKTFLGARRELDELAKLFCAQQFQEAVIKEASNDSVEFKFIPARSPNFGGLWEAAVKSFKTHFKKTIGTRNLTYDEFVTVLVQIEACLNLRPLTPLSSDPNDLAVLTPGHFLVQRPLISIAEPNLEEIPENRLSLWQRSQSFVQTIWKKWSTQYLSDLHNRTKWTRRRDNLRIGTMVLLKEENLPPLRWMLGRVTQVHTGSDGCVRVATVKTKDGVYQRGISKICVLPIRDNQPLAESDH